MIGGREPCADGSIEQLRPVLRRQRAALAPEGRVGKLGPASPARSAGGPAISGPVRLLGRDVSRSRPAGPDCPSCGPPWRPDRRRSSAAGRAGARAALRGRRHYGLKDRSLTAAEPSSDKPTPTDRPAPASGPRRRGGTWRSRVEPSSRRPDPHARPAPPLRRDRSSRLAAGLLALPITNRRPPWPGPRRPRSRRHREQADRDRRATSKNSKNFASVPRTSTLRLEKLVKELRPEEGRGDEAAGGRLERSPGQTFRDAGRDCRPEAGPVQCRPGRRPASSPRRRDGRRPRRLDAAGQALQDGKVRSGRARNWKSSKRPPIDKKEAKTLEEKLKQVAKADG